MAVGQGAFSAVADAAALDALELELAVAELDRGRHHAATLRRLLRLLALHTAGGTQVSTVAHAALSMGCSERRADRLLAEAAALAELPGGLEAVECGLLTVEQSAVLVAQFAPLPLPARLQVWRRLQARLSEQGVLPPARLAELLRRWVIAVDPVAAQERRRAAEDGRRVEYRRREDGLVDLFALGFRGPDAHAVLSRIAARSQPVGVWDDRTADQRRFDALKDLLLGRETCVPHRTDGAAAATCGCRAGAPVPCGAEVLVHVRWEAALGTSDEPAELVGHGPVEPDALAELLLASPHLRVVWTDERGVPVAVDDRVVVPPRGDPRGVRRALLDLAERPPQHRQPRAPDDHRTPRPGHAPPPPGQTPPPFGHIEHSTGSARHADGPGPYRPPRRLRRLLAARSPRCEWPGCGARAAACDAEHDLAWPGGPTCACNLGPCCRRHHRVKQCGWTKTRSADGSVAWTGRSGRSWLSAAQHPEPDPAVRPLPPLADDDPLAELSPAALDEELWALGLLPDDDGAVGAVAALDVEPADADRLGDRIERGGTRWTLDLDDPFGWLPSEIDHLD